MLVRGNVRRNMPEGKQHQSTLFRTSHKKACKALHVKKKSSSSSSVFCSPDLKVIAVNILFASIWPWIIQKKKKLQHLANNSQRMVHLWASLKTGQVLCSLALSLSLSPNRYTLLTSDSSSQKPFLAPVLW